ncbi:SubName: Full=Uncharacterized protein {ECO:0000313/EMBL:CCA75437.1} [Serendipita indica DSM 11827]|uniref:Xylanolytic transcriptional activator regulatory domain-containing protein n=1 Tax=Serendipita indica (strain DSM 11827) TaxID=1109443 RepID=G4TVU4_SERID|nr:SubName: Full=Uncharacterized protein {ECO:0000313/EMBL:CCA75437.1} [Serendipita indica DSM 11827]CCA75437.1 hypothetical protein PIIN_09420 [Serendipita indica DSM 11827]
MLHSPEHPQYMYLSSRYMTLSRACLTIDSPISNTTSTSIDILLLHIAYLFACDEPHAYARAEALIGVCMKLAHSIGLHRDPSLWGLSAEESAQRRRTMWELICIDLWAALSAGRPPLTLRRYIDVKFPLDPPDDSDPSPNYTRGKHYFSDACLWHVLELGLAPANTSTYSTVLKLDQKIRKYTLPQGFSVAEPTKPIVCIEEEERNVVDAAESFRKATVSIFREIALLCLHRSYFASALLLPPFQPFNSPYAPSFASAFASACAILTAVRDLYSREPILIMRFAWFWTYGFTCAVILGVLVARTPDCELAERALNEFDLILEVFRRAQANPRAGRGLPALMQLNKRAHDAMDAYRLGTWTPPTATDSKLYHGLGAAASILHSQAAKNGTIPPAGVNAILSTDTSRPLAHKPSQMTQHPPISNVQETVSTSWDTATRASNPSTILKSAASNDPFNTSDRFMQDMVDASFFPPTQDPLNGTGNWSLNPPEDLPTAQGFGDGYADYTQPFAVPPFNSSENTSFSTSLAGDFFTSAANPMITGNSTEDNLSLWDSLLREFGVANPTQF